MFANNFRNTFILILLVGFFACKNLKTKWIYGNRGNGCNSRTSTGKNGNGFSDYCANFCAGSQYAACRSDYCQVWTKDSWGHWSWYGCDQLTWYSDDVMVKNIQKHQKINSQPNFKLLTNFKLFILFIRSLYLRLIIFPPLKPILSN